MAHFWEWLNMSGALQAVFMNLRSSAEGPPTVIGQAYGGGFYAGDISVAGNGVASHYLIVTPVSSGQSTLQWKSTASDAPGTSSNIDGPQNTANMVADGNSTVYPCAHFCNDAVIGGFSDWYMPAKNELEVCYFNLKPTTTLNLTSPASGINANSVPRRNSNYTSGNPAQTSAANFQSGGAEAFSDLRYWSSTQATIYAGNYQSLVNGFQGTRHKFNSYLVRAIRRVAV
jgi:hypothetical protein